MYKTSDKLNIYVRNDNYAWAVFPDNEKSNENAKAWASNDYRQYQKNVPKQILLDVENKFDSLEIIGYEHRQSRSVFKAKTTTGLIFDLPDREVLDIILTKGIEAEGKITCPSYFIQDRSQMKLVGEGTELDLKVKKEISDAENFKGTNRKLIVGKTYQRKNKELFIYLGEMYCLEAIYKIDKTLAFDKQKQKIGMKYHKKHIVIDHPNYMIPNMGSADSFFAQKIDVKNNKDSSYLCLTATVKEPTALCMTEKQYSYMDIEKDYKEHIRYNFFLDILYLASFEINGSGYNYKNQLSTYLDYRPLLLTQVEYDELIKEGKEFYNYILSNYKGK